MIEYLLDSSICIRLLRTSPPHLLNRLTNSRDGVATSCVVLMELRFGAEKANRRDHQHKLVDQLMERLVLLQYDAQAAAHTAEIRANLDRRGLRIGGYDSMIAGHARSRGLIVVTGNLNEFARVEGLRAEDWTEPAA